MIYFNSKHLYTAYGWRSAAHARDHGWPLFLADLLHQSIGRAIWTIGVRLGVGPVIRFEVSDVLDVFSANRAVVKRVVIRARHDAGVVGECCHDAAWSVLRGVQGRKSSARARSAAGRARTQPRQARACCAAAGPGKSQAEAARHRRPCRQRTPRPTHKHTHGHVLMQPR